MPPRRAAPRVVPDTSIPAAAGTLTALGASVTGGVYRAPQITLAAGVRLALTSDLTLVADNALRIDGIIALAPGVGQPVHVVLVSLNDSVRIGPAGRVGPSGQTAADGIDAMHDAASAMASSPPGVNEGYVKILAPLGSIVIEGEVNATSGGAGGLAGASGGAGLLGWRGGDATASAGQGGGGGDVLLAALEDIVVNVGNGSVRAGTGGTGGDANATGRNSEPAKAEGGPGNVGGRITCIGLAADLTTAVNIGGWVVAGSGGAGGLAQARVVSAGFLARGGSSTAGGGKGHRGGAVEFDNCVVSLSGVLESGNGGNGGHGVATGGDGATRFRVSAPGGPAEARGGHAGGTAPIPQFANPSGAPGQGRVTRGGAPGVYCTGGTATGVGGSGGDPPLAGFGGDSGFASADGGTGCSGVPALRATTGPVLALAIRGSPGAVCPPAVSPGTN